MPYSLCFYGFIFLLFFLFIYLSLQTDTFINMEKPSLLLLFICLVPLFTALVGTIIEAVSLQDSVTVREKRIKRLLMYYFLSFIVIGSGVSTGLALPEVSVYLWPLTVFSLNIAPVLYYRFVVILTDTGHKEKCYFSFHYIYPFLLGVLCTFLYLYLPADAVWGLFRSVPVMQFILTLIYMILALRILAACYFTDGYIRRLLVHFCCLYDLQYA